MKIQDEKIDMGTKREKQHNKLLLWVQKYCALLKLNFVKSLSFIRLYVITSTDTCWMTYEETFWNDFLIYVWKEDLEYVRNLYLNQVMNKIISIHEGLEDSFLIIIMTD